MAGTGAGCLSGTFGTNVQGALAVNTESSGAFVRQNGSMVNNDFLMWSASGAADSGITVAAASDVQAGTSSTKIVTPQAIANSAAFQTLTPSGSTAWNVANGYNATLALSGNTQKLMNPTNVIIGITYVVIINPGAFTGFTFDTAYDWGAAGTPALTASKDNVISCIAKSTSGANSLYCTAALGF
jgi:hypothetical protein